MRNAVLASASMFVAVLLACAAALLAAVPGDAQTTSTATLVGAGDIAGCSQRSDSATARLLGRIEGTVFTLGDNVQGQGARSEFRNCYDPTWGKFKKRTRPTAGNHEYATTGAKPYFDYFGWRARPRRGYYAYERSSWHIVALNSNCDRDRVGGCGRTSPQGRWLRNNLSNHPAKCTIAYFHHPLYATGKNTTSTKVRPLWEILYNHEADVILSGHAHRYERYAPIRPGGLVDRQQGIRQFVVGTGGPTDGSEIYRGQAPGLQVVKVGTPGVLKLNLGAGSYDWKFVPIAGKTFTDSGTYACH